MEVVYWEGGLLRHEVVAIEAMEKTFKGSEPPNGSSTAKGGTQQRKALAAGTGGMWPWRGYAGFRFADAHSGVMSTANVMLMNSSF